jgi:hypothetical protein
MREKLLIDIVDPILTKAKSDIEAPNRAKLRRANVEPRLVESMTERENKEPNRDKPNTDNCEPSRQTDRNDNDEHR